MPTTAHRRDRSVNVILGAKEAHNQIARILSLTLKETPLEFRSPLSLVSHAADVQAGRSCKQA